MLRVMLVDDEPIVLDNLRMFPWEKQDCELVYLANSGPDALEHLSSCDPDILISDIRMPGLTGLELTERVKANNQETEIILLTGFAEFEYAKQAMSLGVRNYLLKPFRFEDIETALNSCIDVIKERKERKIHQKMIQDKLQEISPILTEQVYQDLLEGRIGDYSEKLKACGIKESIYIVAAAQCDTPGSPLDIALYAQLRELLAGMEQEIYLAQGLDIISLVFCFRVSHTDEFCYEAAIRFCEMLQNSVIEKLGFEISFGISLANRDIFMLHQLKKQAVQALNCRDALGNGSLMLFSDLKHNGAHGSFNMTMYEKKIQKCIVRNQTKELEDVCQEMFSGLRVVAGGDFDYVRREVINIVVLTWRFAETYASNNSADYEGLEILLRCESMEKLIEHTIRILKTLIDQHPVSFGDGIADKIIDYMESHLDQNITLDLLSQNMNYSTAYLSRLIKKNTGQSFSELLQEMRLKRVMHLLQTTDEKISEIAVKTGYNDVSYFIATFKKKTGVTPKEWRNLSMLGGIE